MSRSEAPSADQKRRVIQTHSSQADDFAESYESVDDGFSGCFSYSRRRLHVWLDRLLPARGDGLRLLDVGCGTGHHLAQLASRGFDGTGIDGSEQMLQHARRKKPGAALGCADVEALPFSDRTFDLVLCVEVLRYLPDPARCIGEMARVLRPGGFCLATAAPILNLNGYWLVNRIVNRIPFGNFVRLKQFFTTSRRLRKVFGRSGFSTVDVHGVYLGPVNWVERLLPRALPRTLRAWEPIDAALADRPIAREFSNMFLVRAIRA